MSSYIKIQTIRLTSNQTAINFTSIPTTLNSKNLKHLVLTCRIPAASTLYAPILRFNNSSGTYESLFMGDNIDGTSVSGDDPSGSSLSLNVGGGDADETVFMMTIFDFASTEKDKVCLYRLGTRVDRNIIGALRWQGLSAITSIDFSGATFQSSATLTLYGIEG